MKTAFLLLIGIAMLTACKKETHNPPYSIWYINGEERTSNNVTSYSSKGIYGMECRDQDGFYFYFGLNSYKDRMSTDSRFYGSYCSFTFGGKSYGSPHDTFFYIHDVPGQDAFTIDTEWVYRFQDHDTTYAKVDSVLIWGTFRWP